VSGVRLIGVDLHAARLAEAFGRVGPNSAVMVRADLAQPLPLRDGSVDVVVCHNVVELLPDPLSLFAGVARVLRPGGRLVLLCLDEHGQHEVTARYGERHPGFSPGKVRGLLVRAGLQVVTSEGTSREARKPHLQVVLAIADKPTA
jgi:SAM-dependent methyltransferase